MYKDDEMTIPHVTRNDTVKASLYAFWGLLIALSLIVGTVWLVTSA